MNKIYNFINKIGKQNIILIIFILFVIAITSLYQTFSLVTTTDTSRIIEGLLTYKFILNSDNNNYSITVAANSSKNAMLTVSNTEEIKLKYGIYYGSTSSLTSVTIGYLSTSEHQGTGLIEGKTDYIVYLKIKNDSSSDITINFGVSYGFENGGDLLLDTGKHWLSLYEIKLNSVAPGSYVKYTGSNGCSGKACEGQNVNYVSDSNMGYCDSSSYKFQVNGWRIAYIQNESAYLVSAGSPECVRTYVENISSSTSTQTLSTNYYYGSGYKFNETTGRYSLTGVTSSTLAWSSKYSSIIASTPYTCKNTSSTGTCSTMYKVTSYSSSTKGVTIPYYNFDGAGVPNHIARLNQVALKYCNPNYAYNGGCNSTSSWSINDSDYQVLTTNIGANKTLDNCFGGSNESCGKNYDLIDNGGYYWFATPYSASSTVTFGWYPAARYVDNYNSNYMRGVRPVLRLRSSVLVVSGSGTYADPYVIE